MFTAILLFVTSFVLRYTVSFVLKGVSFGALSVAALKCADVVAFLLPFVIYRTFSKTEKKTFELKRKISCAHLFFITLFAASAASYLEGRVYGISDGTINVSPEMAASVAVSVLLVPAAEEYVFRGTIMPMLANFGFVPSAIFASAMFCAVHGAGARAYAFIWGLFLSYVYVLYGIKRSILFHMAINAFNVALAILQSFLGFKVTAVYLAVSFVLAVLSTVFIVKSAKRSVGNG